MIEKKYGTDARMEFEIGALLEIQNKTVEISQSLSKNIKGTKNFGVEGVRNNSYFGNTGISKTHDSDGNYNEPKIKK